MNTSFRALSNVTVVNHEMEVGSMIGLAVFACLLCLCCLSGPEIDPRKPLRSGI
jgi:hypothetical protein